MMKKIKGSTKSNFLLYADRFNFPVGKLREGPDCQWTEGGQLEHKYHTATFLDAFREGAEVRSIK